MGKFEAGMEGMAETYIYETTSLLERLDQILMDTESNSGFGEEDINEIFRIMHTIKGSSAMMGLDNMASLSHSIEDMFYIIREEKPAIKAIQKLFDILFEASDSLKAELGFIQEDEYTPTDFSEQTKNIKDYVAILKSPQENITDAQNLNGEASAQTGESAEQYQGLDFIDDEKISFESDDASWITVRVFFDDDIEMENLRALLLVNELKDFCSEISYIPEDIEDNPQTSKIIVEKGFLINLKPVDSSDDITKILKNSISVKSFEYLSNNENESGSNIKVSLKKDTGLTSDTDNTAALVSDKLQENVQTKVIVEEKYPSEYRKALAEMAMQKENEKNTSDTNHKNEELSKAVSNKNAVQQGGSKGKQSIISVNLNKLDQLLDMVGEIVITEAMVTSNPDLKGLRLDNFQKAARQLRKLTDELQDIVMSIRMVPISGAFSKMTRVVRDMKIKLNKDVDLVFEGEETEVDKSVIDSLFDPLMHMVRNSMDHGIENDPQERIEKGKPAKGTVTLSAYNSSGEVIIAVSDDGAGIDCEKVLEKAAKNGMLTKPETEYSEKEIFNMIMLPGFSTNDEVTEFSGRGVGMDVVRRNIEKIGGSVSVDSKWGEGTSFIIKIPLSLAIVDGIEVSVGKSIFTIPINSIKESIKLKENQLVRDTSGREMVMIRGECFPLVRLHEVYGLEAVYDNPYDGMVIVVEAEGKSACILADELIGEQQVVVKPFSPLLNRYNVKQSGMAGCTILGDGSITIILDVNNIIIDK